MRLTILGTSSSWHVQQVVTSASRRGFKVDVRPFSTLSAQIDSRTQTTSLNDNPPADVVLVRSMPRGTLEQVIFRMDVLASYQQAGSRVVNSPRSLEIAIDKYLGLARMASVGLPVPRTVVCQDVDQARQAIHDLGGDVVIKPLFGSEGRGVARLRSSEDVEIELAKCQQTTGLFYLQEFIPHAGFDYRLFVIGTEVIAMQRQNPDDWRLNVRLGARPHPLEVNTDLQRLAVLACRAVGAEIAAIDVVPDRDGRLFVLEVNACPGWRALQSITQTDIAERICGYMESRPPLAAVVEPVDRQGCELRGA